MFEWRHIIYQCKGPKTCLLLWHRRRTLSAMQLGQPDGLPSRGIGCLSGSNDLASASAEVLHGPPRRGGTPSITRGWVARSMGRRDVGSSTRSERILRIDQSRLEVFPKDCNRTWLFRQVACNSSGILPIIEDTCPGFKESSEPSTSWATPPKTATKKME